MSNFKDSQSGTQKIPFRSCRVAYSLNEAQPVICTIIDDQPLFYTDHEEALDDLFLDEYEGFSGAHERTAGADFAGLEALNDFVADLMHITGAYTPEKDEGASASEIREILCHSRLAQAYFKALDEWGTELRYSAHCNTAFYDRKTNVIYINPHRAHWHKVLYAAREIRRAWQAHHGALLHPLHFHPDQSILVNRAQVADLTVNMVRIGWELQLADIKEPWSLMESGAMGDLCRSFARESFIDFRALNNGKAAAATFETWFLSSRCEPVDRELIRQMLADYRGYVFGDRQMSKAVTIDLIVALGNMPFGKNYLVPYARTLLEDPVFTDVRDRSNANFLWFIKFEQSFRDAERDLQTTQAVNSREALYGDSEQNKERWIGNEKTAEIIKLERFQKSTVACGRKKRTPGRIVDFRPGAGE